jgi:hypothetical protein
MMVLAVISCSVGQIAPTRVSSPTNTTEANLPATVAIVPTGTSTSRPPSIPTPTTQPQLEIVASRAWKDFEGHLRIEALLKNPADTAIYVDFINAILMDSAGNSLLGEIGHVYDGTVMGGLGRILPGELVPATFCFDCMNPQPELPAWDHYEIHFLDPQEWPISADEYSTDFETSVQSTGSYGLDIVYLNGEVTNTGSRPAEMVYLRAILYDEDGDFLGVADDIVYSLAPGASTSFSMQGLVDPEAKIGKYEITAQSRLENP